MPVTITRWADSSPPDPDALLARLRASGRSYQRIRLSALPSGMWKKRDERPSCLPFPIYQAECIKQNVLSRGGSKTLAQ